MWATAWHTTCSLSLSISGVVEKNLIFAHCRSYGNLMGKKCSNPLNGTELTYLDAKIEEGKKTWIYLVNETEFPEELLALRDMYHIET